MNYDNDFYVTGAKVGKPAPKFEMDAVLPEGEFVDRFGKVTLDEHLEAGKWVVLYFYPLDFTFVCPTEIKKFNELNTKFEEKNAVLIAASTDSVFSHLAWQDRADLGRLNHVHASDGNHVVSEAYGILDEEKGLAWRGTFIIAPDGTLKAAHVNHGEGGRNVDEVLRTLEVFQNEMEGKLVPCGWTPGSDFVVKK
ncbi:Alkyl hydroperoxide reductase subunit C [Candidatus Izimaplasma bacterium HR1]|jgi:alkyl hydroperoxide reductase subunit AhpC|uniref:peroxiredoxin n=1 Tax=Candidatus Izimoplasma sp. HR1 TaxID=1541959 RepID=UPI0004F8DB21|nr:Alkyl hydroperoxide reductase subunit C [Candidatus Izimaplasma bacterium HR1]